jgi:SAM-dependent methyltransferase
MRKHVIQLARFILRHLFRGSRQQCPCCESKLSRFLKVTVEGTTNISCPACGSLERHRLLGAWLEKASRKLLGNVLHVAPEKCLKVLIKRKRALAYVSIDFESGLADQTGDLRRLGFLDGEFDTLVCFHVLEHIAEDQLAMNEMYRVLKSQGSAFISVPIVGMHSEEATASMSDLDRQRRFGQADHVRNYGADIQDRLQASGFKVQLLKASHFLTEHEVQYFGLNLTEILIVATKA